MVLYMLMRWLNFNSLPLSLSLSLSFSLSLFLFNFPLSQLNTDQEETREKREIENEKGERLTKGPIGIV